MFNYKAVAITCTNQFPFDVLESGSCVLEGLAQAEMAVEVRGTCPVSYPVAHPQGWLPVVLLGENSQNSIPVSDLPGSSLLGNLPNSLLKSMITF